MMKHHIYLGILTTIVLIGFALRINELHTMPYGIHNDEATNIIWAWRWSDGYGMPYYFDSRPEPFDGLVRAVWATFVGLTPFAHRYFNILLGVIGIAAVASLARRLYADVTNNHWIAIIASVTLAIIPAHVIIGRSIYRANWVIPMMLIALWCIVYMQAHRNQWRTVILAGVFTGLTAIFYLSGLAVAVALGLSVVIAYVIQRKFSIQRFVLYSGAVIVTMIPWFVLFLTIPNWLGGRVDALEPVNPISQPFEAVESLVASLVPIVYANLTEYENIRYNTLTASFLNPILAVFALIGFAISVKQWQKPHRLTPLIVGIFAVFPAAFSGDPDVVIRTIGLFPTLALLAGLGGYALYRGLNSLRGGVGTIVITVILAGSVFYTHWHIQYHYKENPIIHDDPYHWFSLNGAYHLGFADFSDIIRTNDQPSYVPLNLINANPTALLRPDAFPIVRGYDGRDLPQGQILFPLEGHFDFPPIDIPLQYALFLPEEQAVMLLPPVSLDDAVDLRQRVIDEGDAMMTRHDEWQIGYRFTVNNPEDVFQEHWLLPDTSQPIGQFDDNLTLLDIHAPDRLNAGERFPVTTFWKIEAATQTDYLYTLQPLDPTNEARGIVDEWIYTEFFPTPMWHAGDIIPVTTWVTSYEDAPDTQYRYLVGVYTLPYKTFTPIKPTYPVGYPLNHRLVIDKDFKSFSPLGATAIPMTVNFADKLQLTAFELNQNASKFHIGLEWLPTNAIDTDYTLFLHLEDVNQQIVSQQDTQPFSGRYPTAHWKIDEPVTTYHELAIPDDVTCPCQIFLGWYSPQDLVRLPIVDDTSEVMNDRTLLYSND